MWLRFLKILPSLLQAKKKGAGSSVYPSYYFINVKFLSRYARGAAQGFHKPAHKVEVLLDDLADPKSDHQVNQTFTASLSRLNGERFP